MLSKKDVITFFNGLVYAGIKSNLFSDEAREGQLRDFYERYGSKITAQELAQLGELFKSNGTWPTYQQIDSLLVEIRGASKEQDNGNEDAYPDGEKWQDAALDFGRNLYKELSKEILENNVMPLYWLKQAKEHCENCRGKDCRFYGHRPYLRFSANGECLFQCVSKQICTAYCGNG